MRFAQIDEYLSNRVNNTLSMLKIVFLLQHEIDIENFRLLSNILCRLIPRQRRAKSMLVLILSILVLEVC